MVVGALLALVLKAAPEKAPSSGALAFESDGGKGSD
jgi:hypothetical protein